MELIMSFKYDLQKALNEFMLRTHFNMAEIADKVGVRLYMIQNWKSPNYLYTPNYLVILKLEDVLGADFSAYYPTDCPVILDFILRRIKSDLKRSECAKIMNSSIKMLNAIETSKIGDLTDKQAKAFSKINNWLNKS